ncbi:MAG TPA: tRNA uridine-5-carboxymethylaminomethyl(34) synthesis enzyme MnmG [Ignavibacteria bacterium]|nr:tRNA uridine-5-carboxymethylaminomethyl(34) synthesis enzyme MnmG [Ignavibacteria bacterium]
MNKNFDIIIIGGGHAGIEASVAASKMGCSVGLFSMDLNATGRMSCNPSIGGTAKGHLVKEIDALGGAMGRLADLTGIQFKMLNKSKGPAVWSPRCQSDKEKYIITAKGMISDAEGITFVQETITELVVDESSDENYKYYVKGVKTEQGNEYDTKAVIICSGTFLNAVMFTGKEQTHGGRVGEKPAHGLSESLLSLGFVTGRLKTGTPPRLDINSIDFSKTEIQEGDLNPAPFSHLSSKKEFPYLKQVNCYLTHTNRLTHDILRTGFEDSPLFTGRIKGVGPRYCPSIEDKINRFSDRPRHQIFLEPETLDGGTIYMNGFSTSLPADVQLKAAKTIQGLENVRIIKQGYAVEYDFFPTHQIKQTLETKIVSGLYNAGQVNGTSGYEEAAAQGLIAGINAALKIKNQPEFILRRDEAYIGVLIDDLINKIPLEPYRMFTSSSEYRLILRQDNADLRLMRKGFELGLIDKKYIDELDRKEELISDGIKYFKANTISPSSVNSYLSSKSSSTINQGEFISNIVKRNEVSLSEILPLITNAGGNLIEKIRSSDDVIMQIETFLKYEGYIVRQKEQVERFFTNENIIIPDTFKYSKIKSLSSEALDKLEKIRPRSIGQAMRIAGVRPSDISAILIYMKK